MSYYQTRTVRTTIQDGSGPPKVDTKSYTVTGPAGSSIGFNPNQPGLSNIGSGGQFQIDLGNNFGGRNMNFNIGGGGAAPSQGGYGGQPSGGYGGQSRPAYGGDSSQPSRSQQRLAAAPAPSKPKVTGRPSRQTKKDPFAAYKTQKTDTIRAQCLQNGVLFEDPEFLCQDSSIFFSRPPNREFLWLRPGEIVDNPCWVSDGASRFDVKQGMLGDCWLLAAVASLTCNQKLFERVVDTRQTFKDDYAGIFRFNFWHEGEWKEVVVDDRLPTYNGQLVFMHSADKKEFWSALLEKAYAKLMGSYEALKGGSTSEAMCDFTGGVTEMFDLKKAPQNLFQIMLKAKQRGSLMGCSIEADASEIEAKGDMGLIKGHAYSITNVVLADIRTPNKTGKFPMVRVRNPWGNESEWTGAWSDGSREWNLLSEDEKKELGLTFSDDGEFWMSYMDFIKYFEKLEICNLGPDSLSEEDAGKRWECFKESAEWIKGHSAGGCRNFLDTFGNNPQFRMTLTDVDEDDDDDTCTALIAVLQKDRRKLRQEGFDLLTIGYVIYDVDNPESGPLVKEYFKYHASVAKSPTFINMREVCGRHKLKPGNYAIIPSTFEPNSEGKFLIRIFTEKPNVSGEMDHKTTFTEDNDKKSGPAHPVTDEERRQDDAMKDKFRKLAGVDMEIDAYELRDILNTVFKGSNTTGFQFEGFGTDSCRSMIAMHDGDMSGKLGYEEFAELWTDLRKWKKVFEKFDADRSGMLSTYELTAALNAVGFRVSNACRLALVKRYGNNQSQLEFADFISCVIRLKTMLKTFKSFDANNSGHAQFSLDEFIQSTMYS